MDNRQHVFDADMNKICIVIRVTDQQKYDTTLESLQILEIPEGMTVEICEIYDADSISKAYNQAINQSNAKYKLYIQEGTKILNKKLLVEFIDLFTTEYRAGIAGIAGYEYIPVSCNVSDTKRHYGHIYNMNGNDNFDWITPEKACKEVSFLDSYIVATQYDILWDENYLSAYFSVMTQSMLMKREGYSSIMINTGEYDIAISQLEAKFHPKEVKDFKDSYYREAFPLVSILIPTHNRPEYFKEALESAINQTYRNLEIVVSDDSDDDITYKLIQKYLQVDGRIKYFYHKSISALCNVNLLCDNIRGEYMSWLMDDDLYALNKIEKMIDYYREYDNISLVTSKRTCIDYLGNELKNYNSLNAIRCDSDTIFSGKEVIRSMMLESMVNFIGEPTTVLLKTNLIKNISKSYFAEYKYAGLFARKVIAMDMGLRQIYGMGDMMLWIELLRKGDMAYIVEPLSSFRIHEGQDQNERKYMWIVNSSLGFYLLAHKFYNEKYIINDEKTLINYLKFLKKYYRFDDNFLKEIPSDTLYYKEICIVYEFLNYEIEHNCVIDVFDKYDF